MEIVNKIIILILSAIVAAIPSWLIGALVGYLTLNRRIGEIAWIVATILLIPLVLNKVKEFWKRV